MAVQYVDTELREEWFEYMFRSKLSRAQTRDFCCKAIMKLQKKWVPVARFRCGRKGAFSYERAERL